MSMLKRHYDNVVKHDISIRYPMIIHSYDLPRIEKVVRHWSIFHIGMSADHLPSAWCALHIISGQTPERVVTNKSVARWRRREGDYVSAIVTLRGDNIYSLLDKCLNIVWPQTRPFTGFDVSLMDNNGSCTVPIMQPMLFPGLVDYYEGFVPLFSRPGLSITVHTNCTSIDIGASLLTAIQFPLVNK
jgi:large subunit ribosomal protein L5